MIDFRYHLVSIIAIFMALALGIVVGTTQLNDQVLDNLNGSISNLTKDKRNLESTTRELQDDVGDNDSFLSSVAQDLVAGDLRGESVLLVTAPGTPSELTSELAPLLTAAGATVIGRLQLKPGLLDPVKARQVDDLVSSLRPTALELPAGEPVDRAAVVLAAALVRRPGEEGISAADAEAVLGGFTGEDLVDLDREQGAPRRATLVLVLVPGYGSDQPPTEVDTDRARGVLTAAKAFDQAAVGAVVAGPLEATREGGIVAALRDDDALSDEVSSVDTADRPYGQVLVVKALKDQRLGLARRFGGGPGAEAAVPVPAPS